MSLAHSRCVPARSPSPTTKAFQITTETPAKTQTFQAGNAARPAAGITSARIPGKKREMAMAGAP